MHAEATPDVDVLVRAILDADTKQLAPSARAALDAVGGFPKGTTMCPLPEDLTPAQRRVAEALAERPGIALASYPIPQKVQLRRRWLGLDAASPFERRVAFEHGGVSHSWPIWRVWLELQKQKRDAEIATYLPDPIERLATYADVWVWEPYGLAWPRDTAALIDQVGASGARWAQGYADQLSRLPDPKATQVGGIRYVVTGGEGGLGHWEPPGRPYLSMPAFAALVPIARAGAAIEARWESVIRYSSHVLMLDVVAAIPSERREQALLAAMSRELDKDAISASMLVLPRFPIASIAECTRDLLFGPGMRATFSAKELKPWFAKWAQVCADSPVLAPFAKAKKR